MTQILTIVIDLEGERVSAHYFASDGLTPEVSIAALQAVGRKLQQEAIEAEVQQRVQAATQVVQADGLAEPSTPASDDTEETP